MNHAHWSFHLPEGSRSLPQKWQKDTLLEKLPQTPIYLEMFESLLPNTDFQLSTSTDIILA